MRFRYMVDANQREYNRVGNFLLTLIHCIISHPYDLCYALHVKKVRWKKDLYSQVP
jgi:hypothetical protein